MGEPRTSRHTNRSNPGVPRRNLLFGPVFASFKAILQFSVTKTGDVRLWTRFWTSICFLQSNIANLMVQKSDPKKRDGRMDARTDEQTHTKNLRLSTQKPPRGKSLRLPYKFKKMVEGIRIAEKSIGKITYKTTKNSKVSLNGKRSIYVSADIKRGEKLTKKNIQIVRPSFGLNPRFYELVLKKKSLKNLKTGSRLNLKDLK